MKLDFLIKQTLVVLGVLASAISLGQVRAFALTPESKDMAIAEQPATALNNTQSAATKPPSVTVPKPQPLELTDVSQRAIASSAATEVVVQEEEPNPFQIDDPSILFDEPSTLSSQEPTSTAAADLLLQAPATAEAAPVTTNSIRVGQTNDGETLFEEPNPYDAPVVDDEDGNPRNDSGDGVDDRDDNMDGETLFEEPNPYDAPVVDDEDERTDSGNDAFDDTADDIDDAVDDTDDDIDDAADDTADDIDDAADDIGDEVDDAVDDIEEEAEELGLEGRNNQFNFIGVGGNIGIGGDTALGNTSFAILSKITVAPSVSVRPSILVEDGATLLAPVTYDFAGISTEVITLYPFIGGGTAISFDDEDSEFDLLLTAGVDVPINDSLAITSSINAGLLDSFDIGALLGVVYTF